RRHAEGAAKLTPPAAGKIERAEERGEEGDVAETDRDRGGRGFRGAGDGERDRLRVGPRTGRRRVHAADILVAGLEPLRRTRVVPAEAEALVGIARRTRAARDMGEADGNGEVGAERESLALRPLGHEHAATDVLARRLEERVGRMEHGHVDEARAGAVEERAK